MAHQDLITCTFVELADTLVTDYDIIDFVHTLTVRCTELLGVSDAGVSLADQHGTLNALASSSERMRIIELIEIQRADGPCLDVWRDGRPVRADHLATETRWPIFTPAALHAGFAAVYAVPMRLRDTRIGALNLFSDQPAALPADDEALAQGLADIATIGILHERSLREHQTLTDQLQVALTSRITIEQAKGVLSAQGNLAIDNAFGLLRRHARNTNRRLTDIAADVVARHLTINDLQPLPPPASSPRPKPVP